MRDDAGLEVVAHDAGGASAEVGEHVDMARQPRVLPHVERRLDVRVARERKRSDEEVDFCDLVRLGDGSIDLRELMRLIAEDVVLLSTRLHSKSKGNRLLLPGNSRPAHGEYRDRAGSCSSRISHLSKSSNTH